MEYYANTLCISHTELAEFISVGNLQKMSQRGKITRVRRGCYDTPALFAVDSLPLKYRVEIYRRYPDAQEKADSKPFMDRIEPDGKALMYFEEYILSDGRHLPTDKQMEYANNCAILNAFGKVIDESNSHRIRQSKPKLNKTEFWAKAAASLPRLADRFPNSLPNNPRRLRMKFDEYRRDGYEVMISKKYQNKNAGKVIDDVQQSILLEMIAHHNNLDNVYISKMYNAIAGNKGWKEITPATVGVWREKYDLVTSAGRLGTTNFRAKREMQVKRSRPTAPFLMWSIDGWDVELLYQMTTTNKKGHSVTTYTNRMTIVVVLDPCCNYPIGYAIGTHETPELIKEALRNAAVHSRELFGEMLRANQIQCDHYAIKAMSPLYGVIGEKVTPAQVKNAKTKPVEPYFRYLNDTYCKLCNNWSGYGITTNPSRQPNSEALNKLRHTFPDEQGVREQITQMMELERNRKVEELRRLMGNLPAERRLPLSREQYLLNFGAETGHRNAIEGPGLRPTIMGEKRDYDCWDIRFREHASERWTVKYDPEDLSEVLAVNEDGTLRFMLTEKYVQPMALADRKEGDAEELAKINQFNKEVETHVRTKMLEVHKHSERLINGDATAQKLLGRLLIVDSKGQHKMPKAQARLAASVEDVDAEVCDDYHLLATPYSPYCKATEGELNGDGNDYSIF